MSTVNDNMQAVAAAWVINERLVYHSQPGRLLAGLNYEQTQVFEVDGEDDLPKLMPWTVGFVENIFSGSPKSASSGRLEANAPVQQTQTLTYRLSCSRKHGFFRRDPTDTTASKGLMEWLALILDAMETTRDGNDGADARLETSLANPISFRITDSETTQLAYHLFIEVDLGVVPWCRGERSFDFPELT